MIAALLLSLASAAATSSGGEVAFTAYEDCVRIALEPRKSQHLTVEDIASIVTSACSAERAALRAAAVAGRAPGKSPEEAGLEAEMRLLTIEASLAARRATEGPLRIVPADQGLPR